MCLADTTAAQPWRALAAVGMLSSSSASFHLPALPPSLHDHYSLRRYYGGSDFVLGGSSTSERHELRISQADLPDYCVWSSNHSVSNHLQSVRRLRGIAPCRSPDARGSCPPRQASHSARRLAHLCRPNRVHFVHLYRRTALRTGRFRSVALHPVFPRRSYGSIPHDSSPHRSGLAPLRPSTISGARARTLVRRDARWRRRLSNIAGPTLGCCRSCGINPAPRSGAGRAVCVASTPDRQSLPQFSNPSHVPTLKRAEARAPRSERPSCVSIDDGRDIALRCPRPRPSGRNQKLAIGSPAPARSVRRALPVFRLPDGSSQDARRPDQMATATKKHKKRKTEQLL